jgi:hypothetical protein
MYPKTIFFVIVNLRVKSMKLSVFVRVDALDRLIHHKQSSEQLHKGLFLIQDLLLGDSRQGLLNNGLRLQDKLLILCEQQQADTATGGLGGRLPVASIELLSEFVEGGRTIHCDQGQLVVQLFVVEEGELGGPVDLEVPVVECAEGGVRGDRLERVLYGRVFSNRHPGGGQPRAPEATPAGAGIGSFLDAQFAGSVWLDRPDHGAFAFDHLSVNLVK